MNKLLLFWRTMIVLSFFAVLLFVAFIISMHYERGPSVYADFKSAIEILAGLAVTKTAVEHLANTGGAIAAGKALLTGSAPLTEAPK